MRVKLTQAEIDALIDLARYVLTEPSRNWLAVQSTRQRVAAERALATLRRMRDEKPLDRPDLKGAD